VARHATHLTLVLFIPGDHEPVLELPLDPVFNRTGDVWHVHVGGLDPGVEYGFRAGRQPNLVPRIHRFDPGKILIDPYGRAVAGLETWGTGRGVSRAARLERMRSFLVGQEFDWGREHPLNIHPADSVIYEMHVRGFTRHESSGVSHPGTYRGVVEKIPYLVELGVTAVELMPVTEFEESDNLRNNPETGEPLVNFWGYQPVSFFAPKASYAATAARGGAVREFKEMVKALHEAGIEVILDMVFNHTAEGDERGPTFAYRGFANTTYYLLDPKDGRYLNYSGCGNTTNCNHPVTRGLIISALRYWVTEMHVDGFRFDLASILGRGQDGSALANPPLVELIAMDPVLANVKLIAEAWDAAGLYQVGSFPSWGRWAEWNGRYRDDLRRFVKSDAGMVPALATRLSGSADLYRGSGRAPWHSVNFVTSHDGFTLADLVSYDRKHNELNGEENRDGGDDNNSWNCGVEGPSTDQDVLELRARQVRNMAALQFVSQGMPMILSGDELGRSQNGNNNAWCHDSALTWIDWSLAKSNNALFDFFRRLIAFRKAHPSLRRRTFFEDEPGAGPLQVAWHGRKLGLPDWSQESRVLAMHLPSGRGDDDIYVAANAHWQAHDFALPPLPAGRVWRRFVDTSLPPPDDSVEPGREAILPGQKLYRVGSRSVLILVGR
jgi:glycogen operon protein